MEASPLLVRKRIIELYEQSKQTKEIAGSFGICRSGTRRVKQHLREHGTLAPLPRNSGRKPKLTAELTQKIRDYIAAHPDATRAELKTELEIPVSLQAISKWLTKLGLVLKKVPACRRTGSTRFEGCTPTLARTPEGRTAQKACIY